MVSAFWHGFYPNYYSFFFFCFLIEQTAGLITSKTTYFDWIDNQYNKNIVGKLIYFFLGGFHLNIMNFFGLYFSLLFLDRAIAFSINMLFIPFILLILFYALAVALPKKKNKIITPEDIKNITNESVTENIKTTLHETLERSDSNVKSPMKGRALYDEKKEL